MGQSNRDFGLRSSQLISGKSFRIEEHLETQSGEVPKTAEDDPQGN